MKIKHFCTDYIYDITESINEMIKKDEVKEIVSLSQSSINSGNNILHYAILIYK